MNSSIDDLRHVVRHCPVIDNHAHNLLRPHGLRSSDFLAITSEATGEALQDAPTTLAHIRAAKQLRKLYDLPAGADWETIQQERRRILYEDPDALTRRCLEGTQTILIDDGLGNPDDFESYRWHSQFTHSPCKRIVRIEAVAASILASLHQQWKLPVGISIADEEACSLAWVQFITAFEQAIARAIEDDEVAGFKSVICYRSGLGVSVGRDLEVTEKGLKSFMEHFLPDCEAKSFRVQSKGMNDALVVSCCKLIAAGFAERGRAKPLQFHTGLGDNDISLLDSNPAYLQPLIAAFPTVPIVLLHSAYPYTQQAGYLATVYKNAYLDIGEVFPMVSRSGQEEIVRQALELTPMSKILWSTDGHLQAETYWLANFQGREALERVFVSLVLKEDLTAEQAVEAVQGIFFNNSNELYDLGIHLHLPMIPGNPIGSSAQLKMRDELTRVLRSKKVLGAQLHAPTEPPTDAGLKDIQFFFVQWLDWMGTLRARCLPSHRLLSSGDQFRLGISRGNLGTLQNDTSTPVCNPVGQIYVRPDMQTLKRMHQGNLPGPVATLMASFEEDNGIAVGLCPRSLLAKTVAKLKGEFAVDMLIGFEIEITFCRRNEDGSGAAFEPLDTNHAWSTFTDTQYTESFGLIMAIVQALDDIGIHLEQTHSESGAGQYEFVLPPLPPVQAVDTLVQARQCIQQCAALHNLRATCHPQPFPGIGTACHANISLHSLDDKNALEEMQMSFMASVLSHLPGLCALTMPQAVSYARVADDTWTSGTWVTWGTQNRETPLRRVASGEGLSVRWEVRCLDGMGNMYLALYAIVRAGLQGIEEGVQMELGDCQSNPSVLTDAERTDLGIKARLPHSIEESLEALEGDTALKDAIGLQVVDHFVTMKRAETDILNAMPESERRVWLMERY